MSVKHKKQFGIWMDSQHATIIGREGVEDGDFVVLAHAKNTESSSNSSEKAANNAERSLQQKFFKEISSHLQNAEELYVTGTGTEQEQFIRFLAETPQFKNVVATESTSNKMSDERLVSYMTEHFK